MEPKPSYLKYSIAKVIDVPKHKPIKEKHIRATILGSYQDKGGATFWTVVATIPIHSSIIIIWRFCYAFHKVLREGHPNFIIDSQRFKPWIAALGPSWALWVNRFGKTVASYCSLVAKRLEFHAKNPQFTGDLQLNQEAEQIIESGDANNIIQMAGDIMDNLAEILELQTNVFSALKGQEDHFQMAALIPCIADSEQFLVVLMRLLKKLHSNDISVSAAKINEHRERFSVQYNGLREFYKTAGSLVFFKQLTHVPSLSEAPPVFVSSQESPSAGIVSNNPFLTPETPTSAQIIFVNMLNK